MMSIARSAALHVLVLAMVVAPGRLFAASAGDLDLTFAGDGSVTTAIGSSQADARDVVIQPDGRIVVVGSSGNGVADDFTLVRYEADGTLDASFGSGGIVTTAIGSSMDRAAGVALQSDGKIVVVGAANTGSDLDFAVARYDSDGNLDPSFGSGGTVTTAMGSYGDGASAVAIQPDGMIVVAGWSWTGSADDLAIARYDVDGNLDPTFGSGGTVTTSFGGGYFVLARLALQADGRIVVVGTASNGTDFDFALARYDGDGALDPSFGGDGKVTTALGAGDDFATGVVVQPDGKIVAAGWTTDGNGRFALARYLPSGDLDPSFGTQGIVTTLVADGGNAFGLAIQPDGKLVAVGGASFDGGQTEFAAVRYAPDGLPDATFGYTGTGAITTAIGSFTASALATAIQPDGKIVAAGLWSPNGFDREIAVVRYVGNVCGDGVIVLREQCDDGNTVGGDGCSAACLLEGCGFGPVTWCRTPIPASKGSVALKDDPSGDRLGWKWQKGSATSVHDFGDPSASADYLMCIYGGPSLLVKAFVPAGEMCDGKPCWRANTHGFKYKSRAGTPDGITQVLLKSGTEGRAQIAVKGRGGGLVIPAPPFTLPVTVQLERLDGSQCWEATYSAPSANGNSQFKAKAD